MDRIEQKRFLSGFSNIASAFGGGFCETKCKTVFKNFSKRGISRIIDSAVLIGFSVTDTIVKIVVNESELCCYMFVFALFWF